MPSVFLHVGQAGNEIGSAFWRLAAAEKPTQRWMFDGRGRCRSVFVDTEPKVVRGVMRALGAERVHPKCSLIEQSGRGNNWAMGFHGNGADSVADKALEALRWQWERCDWCTGVVLTHSLGGGTGSGLGSLLLQALARARAPAPTPAPAPPRRRPRPRPPCRSSATSTRAITSRRSRSRRSRRASYPSARTTPRSPSRTYRSTPMP